MAFLIGPIVDLVTPDEPPKQETTIVQQSNKTIINQATVDVLNEYLTDIATNVIIDNAKSCSASTTQNISLDFSGSKAKCISMVGAKFEQGSTIQLSCIQDSKVNSDIMTKLSAAIDEQIRNNASNEAITAMKAAAEQTAKNGALTLGPLGSPTSTLMTNINSSDNLYSETKTDTNISNIIKNCVSANFSQKDVADCSSKMSQNFELLSRNADIPGECLTFDQLQVTQAANIIHKCIQTSETVTKAVADVLNNLGVTVENVQANKATTDMEATSKNETENKGAAEEVGGAISGVIGSVGNLFALNPVIVIIIALVIVGVVGAYLMFGGSSSQSAPAQSAPYQSAPAPQDNYVESAPKRRPMPYPPQMQLAMEMAKQFAEKNGNKFLDEGKDLTGGAIMIGEVTRPILIYLVIIVLSLYILLRR